GWASLRSAHPTMQELLRGGGDFGVGALGAAGEGGRHVHLLWRGRRDGGFAAVAQPEDRREDADRAELVETASCQSADVKIEQCRAGAERQICRRAVELVFVLDQHPDQFFVHNLVPPETGLLKNSRWCRRRCRISNRCRCAPM